MDLLHSYKYNLSIDHIKKKEPLSARQRRFAGGPIVARDLSGWVFNGTASLFKYLFIFYSLIYM